MYRTCPDCGAHLDPGEICDCSRKAEAAPASVKPEAMDENLAKKANNQIYFTEKE